MSFRRFLACGLSTSLALALSNCSNGQVDTPVPVIVTVTASPTNSAEPGTAGPAEPEQATPTDPALDLAALASEVEQELDVRVGVVMQDRAGAHTGGSLTPRPAWSTIKVPLAIAALRADPSLSGVAHSAITVSDNDAAQQLWESLGGGEQAAAAVEQVLRECGDDHTEVNPQVTRPGFSAFGQTDWSLADQASFARCLSTSTGQAEATVLAAMGEISPQHAYGIGQLEGARFKGGWGPEESGPYLVRQFGYVGDTFISIAAIPADGSYESGQLALTTLAGRLRPHIRS
ncbi:hypothetical protein [Corynebacterium tapiri]|uniref:Serine hydrolase n=1 Tax=Corynebacterium tapiri TaxID=1448266 RepID=A0A5C4U6J7_9CORY|nr:hypothetical protein [Corynebacterium tapiri]TNL98584.1 hypothetical protein FHE74_05120 [Corynebacterium tapiri]